VKPVKAEDKSEQKEEQKPEAEPGKEIESKDEQLMESHTFGQSPR